jgi:DNA-binding GntR family transcriptional regulator
MVVQRHLLRDDVQAAVLGKLIRGDYPVGTRINEVHLAAELGVSRTPLREALSALANDGLIEARPSRGFWLSPLTDTEVRETYPIISELEQFALRTSDAAQLAATAPRLRDHARDIQRSSDPVVAQAADDEWHDLLMSACSNERLKRLICDQKLVVHRYEHAYLSDPSALGESAAQHARIADAIAAGDVEDACRELDRNWLTGMERLIERITGGAE